MSVTFTPEILDTDTIGFTLECACGDARTSTVHATYEAAVEQIAGGTGLPRCGDEFCGAETIHVVGIDAPEVADRPELNMCNGNAMFVADALGIAPEDVSFGAQDAAVFQGAVLLALALAPADLGMPVHAEDPTSMRVIAGARPAGYLQDKLQELHEIAEWALRHDRRVTWA